MEHKTYSMEFAGRNLSFEFGRYAEQAAGSVLVRYGDTAILVSATISEKAREGVDFFPLSVDYEEKLYAVGKIPGGFIKREGRPTEKAVLTCRLIDRPLRPLFPQGMRNDVQIVATSLSVDTNNPPDIPAMLGSSMALSVSQIPWGGPTGSVLVGRVNKQLILNPDEEQRAQSDLHLVVSGTKDAIMMVEAGANEISEEVMLEAIMFAHDAIRELVAFQETIVAEIGKPKASYTKFGQNQEFNQKVRTSVGTRVADALEAAGDKTERQNLLDAIEGEVMAEMLSIGDVNADELHQVIKDVTSDAVRDRILRDGIRPDGRTPKQIRPIWVEVDDGGPADPSGSLRPILRTWPGSGLGPFLAERACTLLGGHLEWEAVQPRGHRFRIVLQRG